MRYASTIVKAELWTNANHDDSQEKYDALPMSKVRSQGELLESEGINSCGCSPRSSARCGTTAPR